MTEESKPDLIVELCTDGSLLVYNKDKTINSSLSDFQSWSKIKQIRKYSKLTGNKRKDIPEEYKFKYIVYYFKNSSTNEKINIPESHIDNLLFNLV